MTNRIKLTLLSMAILFIVCCWWTYQFFILDRWLGFVFSLSLAVVFYFAFIGTLMEVGE
jgi:hypothetical protein